MKLNEFINTNIKKIKVGGTIAIGSLCLIVIVAGLILTILNVNNKPPLTAHEVRDKFSLQYVLNNETKLHYSGYDFNDNNNYETFEILIDLDNQKYELVLDEEQYFINVENGVLTVSDNLLDIVNKTNYLEYIKSKQIELINRIYYSYVVDSVVDNFYDLDSENKIFVVKSLVNDDYLNFDYNGLLINGKVENSFEIQKNS